MTVSETYQSLYAAWSPDLAEATAQRYANDLLRWRMRITDPPVQDVTTETYSRFRAASAAAGDSPDTTETTLQTVRQVMRCAFAHGLIDTLPDPGKARRRNRRPPRPATCEELRKLWNAADAMSWPITDTWMLPAPWWRAWLSLAYWTGLRLTDLTWRLSMEHVRTDSIQYAAGKTKCEHAFPLTDRLRWIVQQCRARPYQPSLLHCARSANLLRKHLRRLCDVAGIRKLTPKHFRQACVTEWTKADSRAGELMHGCGMPGVLRHYINPLDILAAAAPKVAWPFPDAATSSRQLTLF